MAAKKERTIPKDILESVKQLAQYVQDDQGEQESYEEFLKENPGLPPSKHIMYHADAVVEWLQGNK